MKKGPVAAVKCCGMDSDSTLRTLLKARKDLGPVTPLIRQAQEAAKAAQAAEGFVDKPLMRQMLEAREKLDHLRSTEWGSPLRTTVEMDRAVFEPPPAYEAEMAGTLAALLDVIETSAKEQAERDRRGEEREQRMAELTEQSVSLAARSVIWARVGGVAAVIAILVAVILGLA